MLYLHIPYCKKACTYCNFHFSTNQAGKGEMVTAIAKELRIRAVEAADFPGAGQEGLPSVYLGGGTPSLLSSGEMELLFTTIQENYRLQPAAEITLEANPDDLDDAGLAKLAASPVNRLSIGLQSFAEADLEFFGRAHTAAEARSCLDRARRAGFDDLSVDLIYGSPTTPDAIWLDNLQRVIDSGVPHVSAYALTVEEKTVLAHRVKTGVTAAPSDERFARQFDLLVERLTGAGYEHYEISNFAKPGRYSRHNTAYWQGTPYLGIGPAAHGFDGHRERRWNVANNARYVQQWQDITDHADYQSREHLLFEREILSDRDRYNEFIMTGLRTQWGVRPADLTGEFGPAVTAYFLEQTAAARATGELVVDERGNYMLTPAGRRRADGIAGDAFMLEE